MAVPLLRRIEVLALVPRQSDQVMIPVSATVDVYLQGAWVTTTTVVPLQPDSATVPVSESGAIRPGDTLSLGPGTASLTVLSVSSNGIAASATATPVTVPQGTRLLITNRRPSLFASGIGLAGPGLSNPFQTSAVDGRGYCYIGSVRFDYVVSGTGLPTTLVVDQVGGTVNTAVSWQNVLDYFSIQGAMDAIGMTSGVVFLPAGNFTPPPTNVNMPQPPSLFVPPIQFPGAPVSLRGSGVGISILRYSAGPPNGYTGDPNADFVHMTDDYQLLRDMSLIGGLFPVGTGSGVRIWRTSDSLAAIVPNAVYRPIIRDCYIQSSRGWGVILDDQPRNAVPQFVVGALLERVETQLSNNGGGYYIGIGGASGVLQNCKARDMLNKAFAKMRIRSNTSLRARTAVFDSGFTISVLLEDCITTGMWHMYFEDSIDATTPFVRLSGGSEGTTLGSCLFIQGFAPPGGGPVPTPCLDVGGSYRGLVVVAPSIHVASGPVAAPTPASVTLAVPSPPNPGPEVTLVGGELSDTLSANSPPQFQDRLPSLADASQQATQLGMQLTLGLPSVAAATESALLRASAGDILFGTNADRMRVFDGMIWHTI